MWSVLGGRGIQYAAGEVLNIRQQLHMLQLTCSFIYIQLPKEQRRVPNTYSREDSGWDANLYKLLLQPLSWADISSRTDVDGRVADCPGLPSPTLGLHIPLAMPRCSVQGTCTHMERRLENLWRTRTPSCSTIRLVANSGSHSGREPPTGTIARELPSPHPQAGMRRVPGKCLKLIWKLDFVHIGK